MQTSEKLSQDESEWGLTRVELFIKDNRKLQQLNRERRKKYLHKMGVDVERFVEAPSIDPFMTSIGMMAYRARVANRVSLGSAGPDFHDVSLPFVSIQHGREG